MEEDSDRGGGGGEGTEGGKMPKGLGLLAPGVGPMEKVQ